MYDSEKHKNYRKKQAHKMAGYQKTYRLKRRKYLHELKKKLSCVYCGNNNPLCLDLDHIDRSSKNGVVATMITSGYDWNDVLEEIEKCQPVCSNCHKIKTIIESDKMQGIDIESYVPDSMKHLLCAPQVSV